MDALTTHDPHLVAQAPFVHPVNTLAEQVLTLAGEAAQIEIAVGLLHTRIEKLDRRLPIDIAEAGYALRDAACDLRRVVAAVVGGRTMRAPDPAGQGVRRCCGNPACTRLLDVKPVGRSRKFCCDRCRQEAHRHPGGLSRNPDFRDFNGGPYPSEGLSRNPKKTSTKSKLKIAVLGDRGSPANGVLVTVGLGVSPSVPVPVPADDSDRSALIRKAIRIEFAARWPTYTHIANQKRGSTTDAGPNKRSRTVGHVHHARGEGICGGGR